VVSKARRTASKAVRKAKSKAVRVRRAVKQAAENPKVQAATAAVLGTAAVVTAAVAMNRAEESRPENAEGMPQV
jgi:hypothetical protein